MRIKIKKYYFITACYLTAFAVVGAGFAYRMYLSDEKYERRENSLRYNTLCDGVFHLENLAGELSLLAASPDDQREVRLSKIRISAELAHSFFSRTSIKTGVCSDLLSFFSVCSESARQGLLYGIVAEKTEKGEAGKAPVPLALISELSNYAQKLEAVLPREAKDVHKFETNVNNIFADSNRNVLLTEYGFNISKNKSEFSAINGEIIEPEDACKIARKVLGTYAHLTVSEANGSIPVYSIGGKNISAIVSKKGGVLLQFLFDLNPGKKRLTETEAQDIAEKFIIEKELVPDGFIVYESSYKDGIYVYTFAPLTKEGISRDYEKVRIGVSHGSGRIVLFDALDYYKYFSKEI